MDNKYVYRYVHAKVKLIRTAACNDDKCISGCKCMYIYVYVQYMDTLVKMRMYVYVRADLLEYFKRSKPIRLLDKKN